MKVLLTGFDPFGGEAVNPAQEAVQRVSDNINGAEVIKITIPTVQTKSVKAIEEAIELYNPDIVISVGQAAGRYDITPERVAINIDDFRIKDNEGNQPTDKIIQEDGKSAYFSNLPVKAMVKHMNDNQIPATLSNTAGTFVCNHVMYGVLYLVDKKYPNIRAGFIHVPYIPAQVVDKPEKPSMSTIDISKGLELSIKAAVENSEDIKAVGGAIC